MTKPVKKTGSNLPPGPGPGRPKGLPNRSTQILKAAIMGAFDASGGEAYLIDVAKNDPKTFCMLLAKILPAEIKADVALNEGLAERLDSARRRASAG